MTEGANELTSKLDCGNGQVKYYTVNVTGVYNQQPRLVEAMTDNNVTISSSVNREPSSSLPPNTDDAEDSSSDNEGSNADNSGNGDDGNGGDNGDCDPSYPDDCIPSSPPDLDCGDNGVPNDFKVTGSDPHGFDRDSNGIGCESNSPQPPPENEENIGNNNDLFEENDETDSSDEEIGDLFE
jgi:hypothetical protein